MGEANIKFAQGDHEKAISICMDIIKMGIKDTLSAVSCFKDILTHNLNQILYTKKLWCIDIKTQYSYLYLARIVQNKTPVFCIIKRINFSALVNIYSNPDFSSRSIHALSDTGPYLWGPGGPQEIPSGEMIQTLSCDNQDWW